MACEQINRTESKAISPRNSRQSGQGQSERKFIEDVGPIRSTRRLVRAWRRKSGQEIPDEEAEKLRRVAMSSNTSRISRNN